MRAEVVFCRGGKTMVRFLQIHLLGLIFVHNHLLPTDRDFSDVVWSPKKSLEQHLLHKKRRIGIQFHFWTLFFLFVC